MSGAATPMQLLPILLPNRWTTPGTCGQLWNGGSAYGQRRTILGAVPTPTDQMVAAILAVMAESARSMVIERYRRQPDGQPVRQPSTATGTHRGDSEQSPPTE